MAITSKLRRHKLMERTLRALMGNNIPTRFKFKDTYDSIEVPTASQQHLPTQEEIETKFAELEVEEEAVIAREASNVTVISKTDSAITSNLEVGTSNLFVNTQTGRVGIGKTDPQYTLDVNGNLQVGTSNLFVNTQTGRVGIGKTDPQYTLDVNGNLQVGTSNLFVNTQTGRVGIGKTDPQYTLDVNGNLQVGTSKLFVNTQTGRVGVGTTTPSYPLHVIGNIYRTGNITAYSDKRAKSDIVKIENALDKIDQLNGYTYTMNDERYTGLIAQEVLPVLPEAVVGSEETSYAIAYGNMMGLVIEAIKELRKRTETQ